MKLSKSFFYTLRENAKDEDSVSSNLLVRAGMIKKSSNGMYMIMPMGKKVLAKIENIVREEMDAKDAQELLMPALIPEEVYIKSGRREVFGSNMFTMNDRYMKRYVLGPTHEELFAVAASMDGKSYKDFPYNLYQIQTKFRDETRPRYGLIRVREFIMKDAYTFDIDEAGLDEAYAKMYDAYCRIFDRMELEYKIVKADTGAMGGLLSEEYQAISGIGEDIVVGCEGCDFSSNLEITEVVDTLQDSHEEELEIQLVETPNAKTIEEVAAFFGKEPKDFVKTLLYNVDGKIVAFCIPGDRELNETKALKLLKANEMELASFEDVEKVTHARVGFALSFQFLELLVLGGDVETVEYRPFQVEARVEGLIESSFLFGGFTRGAQFSFRGAEVAAVSGSQVQCGQCACVGQRGVVAACLFIVAGYAQGVVVEQPFFQARLQVVDGWLCLRGDGGTGYGCQ